MGVKVREVPGKGWYVFINWKSQRKAKAFGKNKVLAKDFASKIEARLKLGDAGLLTHSGITLEAYTETWLDHIRHTRKPSTAEDYKKRLNQDIYPILRTVDLRSITRERVKAVALAGFTKNQAPKTVQNTIRVLSSLYDLVDTSKRVGHAHPGGGHHGSNKTSVYSGVQAGGRQAGDGRRASDRPGRSGSRPHAESVAALEAGRRRGSRCAFPGKGRRKPHEEELVRLKRDLARVTQERDFLKSVAAYFARPTP